MREKSPLNPSALYYCGGFQVKGGGVNCAPGIASRVAAQLISVEILNVAQILSLSQPSRMEKNDINSVERLAPLRMIEAQLMAPLKPLNTIVL